MKKFEFHWLPGAGEPFVAEGYDVADAFRRAGYGGGAIRALDFFNEIEEESSKKKKKRKEERKERHRREA